MPIIICRSAPIEKAAAAIGIAALGVMVTAPFLLTWQTPPIPSFWSEWLAAALGLAAILVLPGGAALRIPGAAWMLLGLAVWIGIGDAIRGPWVTEVSRLYMAYLAWAALLACIGRRLALRVGSVAFAQFLAFALLAGALLVCGAGMFWSQMNGLGWRVFPLQQGGPIGQANHLVAYGWLGLASAIFLRIRDKLPAVVFWLSALLLAWAVAMAGQRSSFLYAAVLIGLAMSGIVNGPERARHRRLVGGIVLLFLLIQAATLLAPGNEAGAPVKPVPMLRAIEQAGGPSVRLQLWRVGLAGVQDAPFFGKGAGSYPAQALEHAHEIPPADNPGPAVNAHNLLVQLGCEFGLPAVLLLLWALWRWFAGRGADDPSFFWAAAVVGILAAHSLVEYPLWHSYFLGPAALLAGAYGRGWGPSLSRRVLVVLAVGSLLAGALWLRGLARDYALIETAFSHGSTEKSMDAARQALLAVPSSSPLSPWVSATACTSLNPVVVAPADGLAVCGAAMNFAPTREAGVHTAILLWRTGQHDAARDLLGRLRLATSAYGPGGIDEMLDRRVPANGPLSPLREAK